MIGNCLKALLPLAIAAQAIASGPCPDAKCAVERLASSSLAFSCGEERRDRLSAMRVIGFGANAVAPLEAALLDVARRGLESRFARNVTFVSIAYATVKGRDSVDLIREAGKALPHATLGLDSALAVALNVSSVVSSGRRIEAFEGTCQVQADPKFVLNRMIHGFEIGRMDVLSEVLDDNALKAVREPAALRAWAWWSSERVSLAGDVMIVYQLTRPRASAPPAAALRPSTGYVQPKHEKFRAHLTFVSGAGRPCGKAKVDLSPQPFPTSRYAFLVHDFDVAQLFAVLGRCATVTPAARETGESDIGFRRLLWEK